MDVKITAAEHLGLNGVSMKAYLEHAREVLLASRGGLGRISKCTIVAFLVRRPACATQDGRPSHANYGFVAYDVGKLLAWTPTPSGRNPQHICMYGQLLQMGSCRERPTPPSLARPANARPRDRWGELANKHVKRGWVTTMDFCEIFQLGRGNIKQACWRVNTKLRKNRCEIEHHPSTNHAPPTKRCKLSDLKHNYPDLL